jgi:hypothetical protein
VSGHTAAGVIRNASGFLFGFLFRISACAPSVQAGAPSVQAEVISSFSLNCPGKYRKITVFISTKNA